MEPLTAPGARPKFSRAVLPSGNVLDTRQPSLTSPRDDFADRELIAARFRRISDSLYFPVFSLRRNRLSDLLTASLYPKIISRGKSVEISIDSKRSEGDA